MGPPSHAAAVATIWNSSASSQGAMVTMSGRQAMKVTSKDPQRAGPVRPH